MGFQSLLYREIENERLLKESLMNKKILDFKSFKNVKSNGVFLEGESFVLSPISDGTKEEIIENSIFEIQEPLYQNGTWKQYQTVIPFNQSNSYDPYFGPFKRTFNTGENEYIDSITISIAGLSQYDGNLTINVLGKELKYLVSDKDVKPLILSQANYQVGAGKIHIDSFTEITFYFDEIIPVRKNENIAVELDIDINGERTLSKFDINYASDTREYGEATFEIEALPIDTKKVIGWEKIDFDRSDFGKVRIDVLDSEDNLLFPDVSVLKDYTDLDMEKYKRLKFKVIIERLGSSKSPVLTNMYFHYYVSAFRDTDINYNEGIYERTLTKTLQKEMNNDGKVWTENMLDLNLSDLFEDEIKIKSLKVSTGDIPNGTKAKIDVYVDNALFETKTLINGNEQLNLNDFSVFEKLKVDFTKLKDSVYFYNGIWSLEIVYERTPK